MVKSQDLGKETSFRFSETAARELEWLSRKLDQRQTAVVESAIHRLAEAPLGAITLLKRGPEELRIDPHL